MEVRIGATLFGWHDDIACVFVRVMNAALLAKSREAMDADMQRIGKTTKLNTFFGYGWDEQGRFWLRQRKFSNGELWDGAILIGEFL